MQLMNGIGWGVLMSRCIRFDLKSNGNVIIKFEDYSLYPQSIKTNHSAKRSQSSFKLKWQPDPVNESISSCKSQDGTEET